MAKRCTWQKAHGMPSWTKLCRGYTATLRRRKANYTCSVTGPKSAVYALQLKRVGKNLQLAKMVCGRQLKLAMQKRRR